MDPAWSTAVSWLVDQSIGRHFNNSMENGVVCLFVSVISLHFWVCFGSRVLEREVAVGLLPARVSFFQQLSWPYFVSINKMC